MSETLRVRDLMTDRVIAVGPGEDLGTLHELMLEHGVRHMPVVDKDGDVVGLVSHRDLLRNSLIEQSDIADFMQEAVLERLKVREVMAECVATITAESDLREAAEIMIENKYGCLPVTEGTRLVGIITESDFVRLMAKGE